MKRSLQTVLGKIGKDRFAILFLAGLLLLIVAVPAKTVERKMLGSERAQPEETAGAQTGGNGAKSAAGSAGEEADATMRYCRQLEQRLEELLMSVEKAGKVKVFVHVSRSAEKIVEKDNPNERKNVYETGKEGDNKNTIELTNETETVYTEDENGRKVPFVSKELCPYIEGIAVVAEGGGDENVKNQITELIEALFGIDTHKIKVVKMKGEKK